MKDAAYFLAAVPEPVRCLGRRLKPFSVGHRILLERFESAFVTGETPTIADLILSVALCSRSYDDALRFLDTKCSTWNMRVWGFKIWLAVKCGLSLTKSAATFAAYVQSGSTFPNVKFKESQNTRDVRVPMVASVKSFLVRCGHSDAESLEKPYGLALWEYAIASASDGRAEIVDAEWRANYDRLAATPQDEVDAMIAAARRGGLN